MKHYLLLVFLISVSNVFCQQTPQFIMPIWFEDDIGNRDTLWVGSDTSASYSEINTHFGEVEITTPFDSVFEVRAVHGDDNEWKTSKIIIEGTDMPLGPCHLPAHTRLMIHAKYLPVTVSWDTALLATNSPCHINTALTPDQFSFLLQNWYEARIIHCMMTKSSIQIDDLFPIPPPDQLEHDFMVEGQGLTTLPGLWYTGFWDVPHCFTTLPSNEPVVRLQSDLLYPNPTDGTLSIKGVLDYERAIIFDSRGKMLKEVHLSSSSFSISEYGSGMYFIALYDKKGKVSVVKVLRN